MKTSNSKIREDITGSSCAICGCNFLNLHRPSVPAWYYQFRPIGRPCLRRDPQGSALSFTLFLCFLNDLSEVIPTFNLCRLRTTSRHGSQIRTLIGQLMPSTVTCKSSSDTATNGACRSIRQKKTVYNIYSLEYANPILNLASKTSLDKLDRTQNAAMRLMTGVLRSTPIVARAAVLWSELSVLVEAARVFLRRTNE